MIFILDNEPTAEYKIVFNSGNYADRKSRSLHKQISAIAERAAIELEFTYLRKKSYCCC